MKLMKFFAKKRVKKVPKKCKKVQKSALFVQKSGFLTFLKFFFYTKKTGVFWGFFVIFGKIRRGLS